MKLKTYSIFILLSFLTFHSALAQRKVTITNGPISKKNKRELFAGFLQPAKSKETFVKINNGFQDRNQSLYSLKNDLTIIRDIDLVSKEKVPGREFMELVYLGGKTFSISKFEREGRIQFFSEEVDYNASKVGANFRMIFSTEKTNLTMGRSIQSNVKIRTDQDNNSLSIVYQIEYEPSMAVGIGMVVFDANLRQVWKKETELNYKPFRFKIDDVKLLNNERLACLITTKNNKKEGIESPRETKQFLWLDRYSTAPVSYNLQDENKSLFDVSMRINSNNEIQCLGLYGEKRGTQLKGVYFANFKESSTSPIFTKYHPLDVSMFKLNPYQGGNSITDDKEMKGFRVKTFVQCDNDEVLLFAEQRELRDGNEISSGGIGADGIVNFTSSNTTFFYKDVLVSKLGSDGSLLWAKVIFKNQKSTNDNGRYSSFGVIHDNDKTHILYNEHVSAAMSPQSQKLITPNFTTESVLICSTLDKDGNHEREVVSQVSSSLINFRPTTLFQAFPKTAYIHADYKKTQRLSRIEIP